MPATLPAMVLDRTRANPRIAYGRNRVYASIRLISWLAQNQILACRGTGQALVSTEPVWAVYSTSVLAHYCGTHPVGKLIAACERMQLIEVERKHGRAKRLRIHPDTWADLIHQPRVATTVGLG